MPNPNIHETDVLPKDIVREPDILNFFMEDINQLLDKYEPGKPDNKPDVTKQLAEIKADRENKIQEHIKKQTEYQETMSKLNMMMNPQ